MPHRIEAAKATVTSLAGNGANLVAVASAAAGLTQQLNQTHPFLYLDLPIWLFFAAAVILSMMGSLVSLFVDLMATPPPSPARLAINLILGFLTGIIGAFVILPSVTAAPPMPLLLLTDGLTDQKILIHWTCSILFHQPILPAQLVISSTCSQSN